MFRFTMPVGRAICAAATSVLFSAAAFGQAAVSSSLESPVPVEAPSATLMASNSLSIFEDQNGVQPPISTGRIRRMNTNRQARIARNIRDAYTHKWEVAGGGGYLRFRTGEYLQKSSEISFFMSATRMLNTRWGIVGDLRGNYGKAKIPNNFSRNNVFRPQISEYNFTGGVQYRFLGNEKYSVSASGTGGVTLSKFGGDAKGLRSETLGMWKDSNANPTFIVSIDVDYNLYNNLAFRVQPTYVGTTFGSTVQNNLGVNAGFVYRFGRQ